MAQQASGHDQDDQKEGEAAYSSPGRALAIVIGAAARLELTTENTVVTSDEEFASAARSDDLLARALGKSLDRATLRLGLIVVIACAIAGTVALLAS